MRNPILLLASAGLLWLASCSSEAPVVDSPDPTTALFRFGLLADIQYADKEDKGTRRYRTAVDRLKVCVEDWKDDPLDFCVQLGDIIDGGETEIESKRDLELVLDVLAGLPMPMEHVIGNHCLEVPRADLLERLELEAPYRSTVRDGWRLLFLDSLDFSVCGWPEGSPEHDAGIEWMAAHPREENPQARVWNGGLREAQLIWLRDELASSQEAGERVLAFTHVPIHAASAEDASVMWNSGDVLALLEASGNVHAVFAGHWHDGGYALKNGIHHVTLKAMCDAPEGTNAYGTVEVWRDRVEILGVSRVESRVLDIATDG